MNPVYRNTIGVVTHVYMEMSQGNSLYSYLKQTNMSFFFLLQNCRTVGQNGSCLGGWYQWEGEEAGKVCKVANMVETLGTHGCKWKNETC
jgi:hypothetical protein